MLGGSFELLRQKVAATDNAWQLRYQAESKWARRADNQLAACKTLASRTTSSALLGVIRLCIRRRRTWRQSSVVDAKPELVCKEATLFVVAFLAVAVLR